jgi:hypothetical protein
LRGICKPLVVEHYTLQLILEGLLEEIHDLRRSL